MPFPKSPFVVKNGSKNLLRIFRRLLFATPAAFSARSPRTSAFQTEVAILSRCTAAFLVSNQTSKDPAVKGFARNPCGRGGVQCS